MCVTLLRILHVEPLTVFNSEGENITDQSEITVVNRFSGNLTLRCLGHAPSNVRDIVWVSEQQGMPTVTFMPSMNNNFTMVSYGYNEANLTINNFIQLYRGTLRCVSASSGRQVTIYVTDGMYVCACVCLYVPYRGLLNSYF